MGIEPTSEAWEASILPLYDARSPEKHQLICSITLRSHAAQEAGTSFRTPIVNAITSRDGRPDLQGISGFRGAMRCLLPDYAVVRAD